MYHYYEALINPKGGTFSGFYARVIDPATQAVVSIYSDDAGTPIATISGVADMAKTDDSGNASFYVAPGSYHLDIYSSDAATFLFRYTDVGMGDGSDVSFIQLGATVSRTAQAKLRESASVKDFGAVGDGVTDDTAAIQAALDALFPTGIRCLYFPPGRYLISDTLECPAGLQSAKFYGSSGYDGVAGPINFGLATSLKWAGATDETKPMVKFDRVSGVVWSGISLNCDYKAGHGLQFMSTTTSGGSAKNIVENCSIHYAKRDGIIIGEWGVPAVGPGNRQFFGSVFRNLTFYGCRVSGIHINEWNADQLMFDSVMVYLDDAPEPQQTDNAFWFDHGGQYSVLLNCQSGGMTVDPLVPSSGYMIRNQGSDNGQSGAPGLHVINCWQEGAGGLYFGVTTTNDSKSFLFEHCSSFTSDPDNYSVYIDLGAGEQIGYTFVACSFLSNIKIGSPIIYTRSLSLVNCSFADGKGLLDADDRLIIDGVYINTDVSGTMIAPRFTDTMFATLTGNVTTVFPGGAEQVGHTFRLIAVQDATGSRTINWTASGAFSNIPPIPALTSSPGAASSFTFVSDGTQYRLVSFAG